MRGVKKGLTLLELLIACSIMAVLVGSLVAAFAGGVRVWERARALGGAPQEATLCLERMERDLRNAFDFPDIAFKGDESSVAFPGLLNVVLPDGSAGERLATIRYVADAERHVLWRVAWPFPEREPPGEGERGVTSVGAVRFAYCATNVSGREVWQSTWLDRTNRPQGVRVTLTIRTGGQDVGVQRTIVLPSA